MSAFSSALPRATSRAILIASPACQQEPVAALQQLGYECAPTTDPYAAVAEICRRPLVYRAVIVSLQSLYREELQLIWTIKRRFPHIEVYVTQTDGRQASLAEAMRYGADGLLSEEGLHRTNPQAPQTEIIPPVRAVEPVVESAAPQPMPLVDETNPNEPVLTADELRALLEEPTAGSEEPL